MSRNFTPLAVVLAAALSSWSCGSTEPAATTQVAAIVVNPSTSTLALNAQLPLQAQVQDGSGAVIPGAAVAWTVQDPTVVSVSSAGVVTALGIGTSQVAASALGRSGIATITVTKTPVASVTVRPNRVDAAIGSQTQLTATALDAAQNTLADRAMIWTTSNAAVASVSASGVVSAIAAGTATITATSEGKSDASVFTVAPGAVSSVSVTPNPVALTAGQATQLAATVKDARGTILTGKSVIWSSSNTSVAAVSATGTVTGVAQGATTITATVDGVSGTCTVNVSSAPVKSVSVSPQSPTVTTGATVQLAATVLDANDQPVSNAVVTWSSSNTAVATVSTSGLVTGVAPGSATITASTGGKSGTTAVTVSLVGVKSVTVAPSTLSLNPGQTGTLAATVTDANGNVVTNRPVAWTTSDQTVATVDATGLVTGVGSGSATITATAGGVSGTAGVTVGPAAVGQVVVNPSSKSLTAGQGTTLTATVSDVNGQPIANPTVTWSSSDTQVASVSASGDVTTSKVGTATITATSGGVSGTSSITVTVGAVTTVVVTPSPAQVKVGSTLQLAAAAQDAQGNTVSGQTFTWSSSNTTLATVSASGGLVLGKKTGTLIVTATTNTPSGLKSGATSVTVK